MVSHFLVVVVLYQIFKPKEQQPKKEAETPLPDDLSDVLENATEEEILELAGVFLTSILW